MVLQGFIAVFTVILAVEIYIGLNVMKYLHADCQNKTEQLKDELSDIRLKQEIIHGVIQEVKDMQERTIDKMEKKIEDEDDTVNKQFKTYVEGLVENVKEKTKDQCNSCNSVGRTSLPRDCQDIHSSGHISTGVYTIYPLPGNIGIEVRCDMDTGPGGWTVFQRRVSASDFYKTWNEYQVGFGNMSENFWLGNQQIHLIVSQGWYKLRIDLTNLVGEERFAEYQVFSLGGAESKYRLFVEGFSGNAGDSLSDHNGMMFSTKDRDNDAYKRSCATMYIGAWWYKSCHVSNLNGDYGNTEFAKGPVWNAWMGYNSPMKTTEMKIRRWDRTQ